jgi:hypothetical protein
MISAEQLRDNAPQRFAPGYCQAGGPIDWFDSLVGCRWPLVGSIIKPDWDGVARRLAGVASQQALLDNTKHEFNGIFLKMSEGFSKEGSEVIISALENVRYDLTALENSHPLNVLKKLLEHGVPRLKGLWTPCGVKPYSLEPYEKTEITRIYCQWEREILRCSGETIEIINEQTDPLPVRVSYRVLFFRSPGPLVKMFARRAEAAASMLKMGGEIVDRIHQMSGFVPAELRGCFCNRFFKDFAESFSAIRGPLQPAQNSPANLSEEISQIYAPILQGLEGISEQLSLFNKLIRGEAPGYSQGASKLFFADVLKDCEGLLGGFDEITPDEVQNRLQKLDERFSGYYNPVFAYLSFISEKARLQLDPEDLMDWWRQKQIPEGLEDWWMQKQITDSTFHDAPEIGHSKLQEVAGVSVAPEGRDGYAVVTVNPSVDCSQETPLSDNTNPLDSIKTREDLVRVFGALLRQSLQDYGYPDLFHFRGSRTTLEFLDDYAKIIQKIVLVRETFGDLLLEINQNFNQDETARLVQGFYTAIKALFRQNRVWGDTENGWARVADGISDISDRFHDLAFIHELYRLDLVLLEEAPDKIEVALKGYLGILRKYMQQSSTGGELREVLELFSEDDKRVLSESESASSVLSKLTGFLTDCPKAHNLGTMPALVAMFALRSLCQLGSTVSADQKELQNGQSRDYISCGAALIQGILDSYKSLYASGLNRAEKNGGQGSQGEFRPSDNMRDIASCIFHGTEAINFLKSILVITDKFNSERPLLGDDINKALTEVIKKAKVIDRKLVYLKFDLPSGSNLEAFKDELVPLVNEALEALAAVNSKQQHYQKKLEEAREILVKIKSW